MNYATEEIHKAKRNFEKKLADNIKSDPKSFYAYSRSKMKTKDKVGPLFNTDGTIADGQQAANLLNAYFTSVFTVENVDLLPDPTELFNRDNMHSLQELILNEDQICKTIENLKPNKAPGVDGLLSRVLKEIANEISVPKFSTVP